MDLFEHIVNSQKNQKKELGDENPNSVILFGVNSDLKEYMDNDYDMLDPTNKKGASGECSSMTRVIALSKLERGFTIIAKYDIGEREWCKSQQELSLDDYPAIIKCYSDDVLFSLSTIMHPIIY